MFERWHTKNRKRDLKQHIKYFNFRSKILLDHPIKSYALDVRDKTKRIGQRESGDLSHVFGDACIDIDGPYKRADIF